jgi:hypothetical protein
MKLLAIALTALNLALVVFTVSAQSRATTLRASAFELVDERGVVRSRLNVEQSGEVVLRLMDREGTIRVKLGASESGSGLMLADETTQPGVHMIARRDASHVTVRAAEGREQVIRP